MRRVASVLLLAFLIWFGAALAPWHSSLFAQSNESPVRTLLSVLGDLRTFLAQDIMFTADLYHHEMESQGIYWNQEWEIESMYRTVTLLDPHFIEAYDVGAYELVRYFKRVEEGMRYLDEGIQYNPNSYDLHFTKGDLLFTQKRYREVLPEANRAMELAWPQYSNPKNDNDKEQWKIGLLNAVRLIAHSYRQLGERDHEVSALLTWNSISPHDAYVHGRLKELGIGT